MCRGEPTILTISDQNMCFRWVAGCACCEEVVKPLESRVMAAQEADVFCVGIEFHNGIVFGHD